MQNGKLIVVAGIKRSGSTVQYNLIRIALEMAGYTVNGCDERYTCRDIPNGEIDLVKIHKFNKGIAETANSVFLTDRDFSGIHNSMETFYGREIDVKRTADMKKHLNMWKIYSRYPIFNYKTWQKDPYFYVTNICLFLDICVSPTKVLDLFNEIELPKKGQDKETLFFHNHISNA